jgi:hypothetical protein
MARRPRRRMRRAPTTRHESADAADAARGRARVVMATGARAALRRLDGGPYGPCG